MLINFILTIITSNYFICHVLKMGIHFFHESFLKILLAFYGG